MQELVAAFQTSRIYDLHFLQLIFNRILDIVMQNKNLQCLMSSCAAGKLPQDCSGRISSFKGFQMRWISIELLPTRKPTKAWLQRRVAYQPLTAVSLSDRRQVLFLRPMQRQIHGDFIKQLMMMMMMMNILTPGDT
ncbi:hypothetical protein CIRG_07911 [Coccidioides immitis RMSCC 2394]|uniref:Uncharacterized protein n=1 Tax=Coccidioides immitis RMSCC 2394 TaxID=404692 RepID=A0A0J6YKM5_COCIT|nr:hypothetical protein CIRG_07911 [Coccidioides immitis RMSCC 2394]